MSPMVFYLLLVFFSDSVEFSFLWFMVPSSSVAESKLPV